jgi:hypothetical protein
MVAPSMLLSSKIPVVTWMGCHQLLMKLTSMANMSWQTQNIQKSIEQVHITQD